MTYIEKHEKESGCVFCNAQAKADSAENLIAFRGQNAYVILNRYPYTSGHLMVIPFVHVFNLEELKRRNPNGNDRAYFTLHHDFCERPITQNLSMWESTSAKRRARAFWVTSTFILCRAGLATRIS
ncbi:hypothetical protein [Candidatus Villigracilis proximus]|uniref:hypothetical protein n=1 Tax=Candidatus Villigracilis proximus TaxID=3140683 RepID=UPI0031E4FDBF